jgi:hypothetical protein
MPGEGGVAGSQPMSTAVNKSPNNFGDLTPYLTFAHFERTLYMFTFPSSISNYT